MTGRGANWPSREGSRHGSGGHGGAHRGTTNADRVRAPYTFVPLNRAVYAPDWASAVSHERPFSDGVCGRFWISITAHTPLFIGAGDPDDGRNARRTRDRTQMSERRRFEIGGQPAIPGSSLRGLVSSIVSIAAFGKMGPRTDDRRLSMRDLQNPKDYTSHFTAIADGLRPKSRAGWLAVDPETGDWWLEPCDWSLVRQDDLERYHREQGGGSIDLGLRQTAPQKYERWTLPAMDVAFTAGPWSTEGAFAKGRWLSRASDLGKGHTTGTIVFTGQPNNRHKATRQQPAKKSDFIFHSPTGERLAVPADVREAFEWAHRNPTNSQPNTEWAFWRPTLNRGGSVPVFWLEDGEARGARIRAIGLAQMFRLPCPTTTHAALAHANPGHLAEAPDLAELIFGFPGDRPGGGLKGRTRFAHARQVEPGNRLDEKPVRVCLLEPRPSFYPAYLEQRDREGGASPPRVAQRQYHDGEKNRPYAAYSTWMDEGAVLRGWKRFPVSSAPRSSAQHTDNVATVFTPAGRGSRFEALVDVHNLRRVELGAVVWALTWGGRAGLRHALGLGKPYGYGAVEIALRPAGFDAAFPSELERNDTGALLAGTDAVAFLEACRDEFVRHMTQEVLPRRLGINDRWEETAVVRTLLAAADPLNGDAAVARGELAYMPDPKLFQIIKGKDRRLVLPAWPSGARAEPVVSPPPDAASMPRSTAPVKSGTAAPRRAFYYGELVRVISQDGDRATIEYPDAPGETEVVLFKSLSWG